MENDSKWESVRGQISGRTHLLFYVDVSPSEQINHPNRKLNLAFTCTFCGNSKLIEANLAQFKKTRGKERKIKSAKVLRDLIKSGKVDIRALSTFGAVSEIEAMGRSFLRDVSERVKDFSFEGDTIKFGEKSISSRVGLVCPWYILSLTLFAKYTSKACAVMKYPGFVFALDPLPGDSVDESDESKSPALEFMKYLLKNTPLSKWWRKAGEDNYLEYTGFGYIGKPTEGSGVLPAKNEGHSILADWIAQSLHAAINFQWYDEDDKEKTDEFRKEIAGIIFDLKDKEKWIHESIQDLYRRAPPRNKSSLPG